MTFPLSLTHLLAIFEREHNNPNHFDEVLSYLTLREQSFVQQGSLLYLNWSHLDVQQVFDHAKEAVDNEEDLPSIHSVSSIFRSVPLPTDLDPALEAFLTAIDETVGYNTEACDYCIEFTFQDLEQSYEAYNTAIMLLQPFQDRLRQVFGPNYAAIAEQLREQEPEPFSDVE